MSDPLNPYSAPKSNINQTDSNEEDRIVFNPRKWVEIRMGIVGKNKLFWELLFREILFISIIMFILEIMNIFPDLDIARKIVFYFIVTIFSFFSVFNCLLIWCFFTRKK